MCDSSSPGAVRTGRPELNDGKRPVRKHFLHILFELAADVDAAPSRVTHRSTAARRKERPVTDSGTIRTNRGLGEVSQGNSGRSVASKISIIWCNSVAFPL